MLQQTNLDPQIPNSNSNGKPPILVGGGPDGCRGRRSGGGGRRGGWWAVESGSCLRFVFDVSPESNRTLKLRRYFVLVNATLNRRYCACWCRATSSVASSSSSSSSSSLSLSSTSAHNSRKQWSNLLPLFLVLVFIAEISFLGRLDLTKNADLLNSWTESFYQFTTSSFSSNSIDSVDEDSILGVSGAVDLGGGGGGGGGESCEEWLERVDSVVYGRDFKNEPVLVTSACYWC
ncbi:putative glycosyl transferase family 10 [Helianthus annuus]|nr:putative glycosyl transferase family 10 [Helianthus annuus]